MTIAALALQALLRLGAAPASERLCVVDPKPLVALAPLDYLRIRTVVEPRPYWRSATLVIGDAISEIRQSSVFEPDSVEHAPRTQVIEWKSLHLDAGTYELRLTVVGQAGERCSAQAFITVQ